MTRKRKLEEIEKAKKLSSDEKKLEFIRKAESQGYAPSLLVEVIKSLEKDINKLKIIGNSKTRNTYKLKMKDIIDSLKEDESKEFLIEYANRLDFTKEDIVYVVTKLKNDANKKDFLTNDRNIIDNKLTRSDVTSIIEKMETDSAKIQILSDRNLKKWDLKKQNISLILSTLKEDKNKIKLLNSDKFKLPLLDQVKVVSSMENDNLKLRVLKDINSRNKISESSKIASNIKILSSLKDTNKIINYINNRKNIPEVDNTIKKHRNLIVLSVLNNKEDLSKEQIEKINKMMNIKQTKETPKLKEGMKVGIEIEAIGKNRNGAITADLLKKIRRLTGGFMAKRDASLKGYNNSEGVEVVSPVMQQGDLEKIPIITELMERGGLASNNTCGGHIHVGADYLDSVEAWKNFFEIYNNCEKVFYKMSNPVGEEFRTGLDTYAKPFSNKVNIKKSVNLLKEKDLDSFIEDIKDIQTDKKGSKDRRFGLNLVNVNNIQKNTIEFRLFGGILDDTNNKSKEKPDEKLFNNIRLCTRLVEVAKELGDIELSLKGKERLTKQQKALLRKRNRLFKRVKSEDELAKRFSELLFTEEEQKLYMDRYRNSPERPIIKNISNTNKSPYREIKEEER